MYTIHGFNLSFNTWKVLYVAEELGIRYEYVALDPAKGEHKSPEHLRRHPLGKTPTLDHDGRYLFESGAICRYLAAVEGSDLYTGDAYGRARVDEWLDFFSCHLGRWLGTLLFERVMREQFGMGKKKADVEAEALGFIEQQMPCVDRQLDTGGHIAGDTMTIADPFAFAYIETCRMSDLSLDAYPAVARWCDSFGARETVRRARGLTGR